MGVLQPVKDILIPKFREHSNEELQARAELLAACANRAAKRKAQEAPSVDRGDDRGVESSSSEDTSDEAFLRTHTVEEERERAKYEGDLGSTSVSALNLCYVESSSYAKAGLIWKGKGTARMQSWLRLKAGCPCTYLYRQSNIKQRLSLPHECQHQAV